MRFPRSFGYVLNVIFLLAVAVTLTFLNPEHAKPAAGYGTIFLMVLLLVYPVHWAMRRRSDSVRKAFNAGAVVGTFIAFALLGDHVVAGLLAGVQMAVSLALVPRYVLSPAPRIYVEEDTTQDPAGSAHEFEEWKAWRAARAAGQVH